MLSNDREFEELSANIRHWERMRWVSMTVFIALMGGALTGYVSWRADLETSLYIALRVIGVLLVLIFWVQDERIVAYWAHTRKRALELEEESGIKVFGATPPRGLFSAGSAVRLLYVLFLGLWLTLLFV